MRIVITGSSSGIGRALAERLLERDHLVWGLARSDQAEFAALHENRFHGTRCDVAAWTQVAQAAATIASRWESIDALVTCAGIHGAIGPVRTIDPAQWTATLHANLDGTFHAIRASLEMLARTSRRAKIICFSGGGATQARPNFSAYGAAKTGIVRLVETIAQEERAAALDINTIAPGSINTRLTDEIVALGPTQVGAGEHAAAVRQRNSGGESLTRVLDLVEWLLSPESDGVSGRLISAQWDPWTALRRVKADLADSDIYTLRRILPEERGQAWTTP